MEEKIIQIENPEHIHSLFGDFDKNLKILEEHYGIRIVNRGCEVKLCGSAEAIARAQRAIEGLLMLLNKKEAITEQSLRYVISLSDEDGFSRPAS